MKAVTSLDYRELARRRLPHFLIEAEMRVAMTLTGATNIQKINRDILVREAAFQERR
jgi:isopentenyl diphosphate isomerase/L-lactate dehydrogenase-like FMN-dependent dehydrogenase